MDNAMTIIAIAVAIALMTIVPLMTIADKKDDVAMLAAQTATEAMVDEIASKGAITKEMYDDYLKTLASTGHSYDVEMTVKVSDEDPSKKDITMEGNIGRDVFYEVFTSQIIEALEKQGVYVLDDGDKISIKVKNIDKSLATQLRNAFISITGKNTNNIYAEASRMVP